MIEWLVLCKECGNPTSPLVEDDELTLTYCHYCGTTFLPEEAVVEFDDPYGVYGQPMPPVNWDDILDAPEGDYE